ncbi:MAG: hypothetical protein JWP89_3430 [Schlesneria sp.]|nr:hypothetical protein [Schlesneria sp.]
MRIPLLNLRISVRTSVFPTKSTKRRHSLPLNLTFRSPAILVDPVILGVGESFAGLRSRQAYAPVGFVDRDAGRVAFLDCTGLHEDGSSQ